MYIQVARCSESLVNILGLFGIKSWVNKYLELERFYYKSFLVNFGTSLILGACLIYWMLSALWYLLWLRRFNQCCLLRMNLFAGNV